MDNIKRGLCVGSIVLKDNRVLFVRQAKGHPLEGQWSIPWGMVDEEEYPEDAIIRETKEESNIDVKVEGLIGIQSLPEKGWIGIVFLCSPLSDNLKPDGFEVDKVTYLSLDDIENFKESIEPWCKWLAENVLRGNYSLISPRVDNPYRPLLGFF